MKRTIKVAKNVNHQSSVTVIGRRSIGEVAIKAHSYCFGCDEFAWVFPTPTQARRIAAALLKAADEAEKGRK